MFILLAYCIGRLHRRPPYSIFFSKTAGPIKAKFHVEPPWVGGTKVRSGAGLGHMTKMAATPIYGRNFKNLLLQNQRANDLGAWYAAFGTWAQQSLFK